MAITLLDMLHQAGMLTPSQIDDALQHRVFYGGKIGTNLVELGFLREEDLAQFLSRKLMVPYISPERLLHIPAEVIDLISREMAQKYRAIPIELQKKRLSLVMADPADLSAIDEISFITGYVIKPLIAPEFRLLQALNQYYGVEINPRYQKIIERLNAEAPPPPPPVLPAPAPTIPTTAAAAPPTEKAKDKEGVTSSPTPAPVPAPATPAAKVPPPPLASAKAAPPEKSPASPVPPPLAAAPPRAEPAEILDLEEAEVVEEGALAREVKRYAIDEVSRRLAYIEDRDQIAAILLERFSKSFSCAALFVVRGDIASGWKAYRNAVEIPGFDLVHIPFARPSVLRTVTEGKSYYLGPLVDNPLNQRIRAGIKATGATSALVMPLIVMGRVVDVLYLEGVEGDLADRLPEVQRLLVKGALAFEILICRDKILLG